MFAIIWKGEDKGGILFWSNLYKQFLDYTSFCRKESPNKLLEPHTYYSAHFPVK